MRGLISILFVLISSSVLSQCDSTTWAQPGTYSVEIDTNTFEANITPEIFLTGTDLCFIEANRKSTITNQIHIGIYLITIYPKIKEANKNINE